jgi:acetoin:2,6-dichlorophenolindophenol oxidoreductase subunit beta
MKLYIDHIRSALETCLEQNEKVYLIGEDILDPYGGAFKATKGLSTRYPQRVLSTPISESAIVGIATGMSIRGFRPVAEIMFGDFLTLCVDQIVNSATKFPLMYGESVKVPTVIRTPVGGARGYGPTHSQCLEKLFFGIPGLKVIAGSRVSDPGQLLIKAILEEDTPVLFIEDKGDYGYPLHASGDSGLLVEDFFSCSAYPIATVKNYSEDISPDVVMLAYGGAASLAADLLEELQSEEIHGLLYAPSEVNDVNSLREVVKQLPRKTPVVLAEQGSHGFGWCSEMMAILLEEGCGDRIVRRVTAKANVIPAARQLESETILTRESLKNAVFQVLT